MVRSSARVEPLDFRVDAPAVHTAVDYSPLAPDELLHLHGIDGGIIDTDSERERVSKQDDGRSDVLGRGGIIRSPSPYFVRRVRESPPIPAGVYDRGL